MFFRRGEQRGLVQQGPHAVGADFGGRMQPAEGAHAGEVARQGVLEQAAHPVQGLQPDGGKLAGLALAISPENFAFGQ